VPFWNFIENPDSPEEVELRIEGEIVSDDDAWFYEWWGIKTTSPNAFREALAEHKGKTITVWIDSWGGDVFAAAGIYNALKEHKGKVIVKVDGKAVSAGSVIAMAGEELLMSPVSIMMIHNPWSWAVGEAKDMRHAADVLDQVKETIVNAYQLKTRRSRNKISQLMDEETWMSARKAVAEGFADDILYTDSGTESATQNSFMFSQLAIQNSANASFKRFIEIYQKLQEANPPEPPEPPAPPEPPEPPKDERADIGLLSLLQLKSRVNKNRIRRYEK
jgi:ATP-dependent Clp protease protease subunit